MKHHKGTLCVKSLVILLCVGLAQLSYAEKVSLAIGEWAPYTSSSSAQGKIAEKIVTEAFRLEGVDIEYKYYPWKRSYVMVQNGSADGTFPWYSNPKRKTEMVVSKEELVRVEEVFFHRKSLDFNWESFSDLKNYTVGGTIGYSHVDTLQEAGIKVEATASDASNIKKLYANRIDIFPAGKLVGRYLINKTLPPEKSPEFTYHPKPISEGAMYVLFSKKTKNGKELSDRFDKGLRKLKASGKYAEIMEVFLSGKSNQSN